MTDGLCADAVRGTERTKLLILTTSPLTDRMLWCSRFFQEIAGRLEVTAWTWAHELYRGHAWGVPEVQVESWPPINHFRMFPYTYLRRINEFAWDYRLQPPSRLSHRRHVADVDMRTWLRSAKVPARLIAAARLEQPFERFIGRMLQKPERSPEALRRLQHLQPSLVLATGPMRFEEPGVVAIARNMGIPALALITSWDNLSTKRRMLFEYDGFLVWSEQMRRELHHFYPATRRLPVYVIGAPQFDVFFRPEYVQSRQEFCASAGLRADAPIVLHTLGSPNVVRESHGAMTMAQQIARGELGDAQLLVRPHPAFDTARDAEALRQAHPGVVVQRTGEAAAVHRSQNRQQITEWVNTFRHADVVINFASTVSIDAAICDRPIVNLDYDPEPGQPKQGLVRDANHVWTHFKPIAESGGVWNVNNPEELVAATRTYLQQPELHRDRRRWIAEYVCGELDGRSGERLAAAVLDFAKQRGLPVAPPSVAREYPNRESA